MITCQLNLSHRILSELLRMYQARLTFFPLYSVQKSLSFHSYFRRFLTDEIDFLLL